MLQLCSDSVLPLGISDLLSKLKSLGMSPSELGMINCESAYRLVKNRILDIEQQELICEARSTWSPLQFYVPSSFGKPAFYFFHLLCPQTHRAFSLVRFNVLPSALLSGRFHNIPYSERLCGCNGTSIETWSHTVFHCHRYNGLRVKYLSSVLLRMQGWNDSDMLLQLLSSQNIKILYSVACFFLEVVAIHC